MSRRILSKAILAASLAGAWELNPPYRNDRVDNGQTSKRPARYDTNALRDDEQRIKDAQAQQERKRAKRLQQAKQNRRHHHE